MPRQARRARKPRAPRSRSRKGAAPTDVKKVARASGKKPSIPLTRRVKVLELANKSDKKYVINTWATNQANVTTPVFTKSPTFVIVQGDTQTTRNDDRIMLDSYNLRYSLSSSTAVSGYFRIIVLLDKSTNEAAPTTGAIFQDFSAAQMDPFYNANYLGKRFRILYDKTHTFGFIDGVNHYAGGTQEQHHDIKIPVKGIITTFSGNTGAVGSAATNHIYVLYWASSTDGLVSVKDRLGFIG